MFLIVSFLIPVASASVRINEIMYAPTSDLGGSTNEWIEIYNPDDISVDLDNWNFSEMTGTGVIKFHTISNGTILAKSYLILARNDTKFNNYFDVGCSVIKVSFGSGLNNEGDNISLINSNGELVDFVSYTDSITNKSNSLQLLDGEWCEGVPTPGKENVCIQPEIENETINQTINETDNETDEAMTNNTDSNASNEIIINAINNASGNSSKNISANISKTNVLKDNTANISSKVNTSKSKEEIKNTAETSGITGKVVYESKNETMKSLSTILLLFLMLLVVIYFVTERKR